MPTTTTMKEDGATEYRLITGRKFTISKHPDVDAADVPGSIVATAVETLNALADFSQSVITNPTLSAIGRHRALDDIQRASITKVARLHGQLGAFQGIVEERLNNHLAIPALRPADMAMILEDIEIREWWRRVGPDDRAAVMTKAATDAQYARALLAVLRSPVPLASDPELRAVRVAWANLRDASNPEMRERIDGEERALDWAKQSLAVIASIVHQLVLTYGSRDKADLLRLLLEDTDERVQGGAYIYGYMPSEIAHAKRLLAARREVSAE